VAFVDANQLTHDLEQSMGVIGSRKLHMWYKPGAVASIPEGRTTTPIIMFMAHAVYSIAVEALGTVVPALATQWYSTMLWCCTGTGEFMQLKDAVSAAPYATEI
jgi:pectinesterase